MRLLLAFAGASLLFAACGSDDSSGASTGGSGGQAASGGAPSGGTSGSGGTATGGAAGGGGTPTGGSGGSATGGADSGTSSRVWGVTLDAIDAVPATVDALGKLPARPTTRIVFDEFVPASEYVSAAQQIHAVSDVMGELLDSFYVSQYSVSEYSARAKEYLDALGPQVDVWEIGNEVNGEWLCGQSASSCTTQQTSDVVTKLQSAYDLVKQKNGKTALTLYYNEDCWSDPKNEMFTWAQANVPASMKQGLDWVLVSYYEDDCNDLQPNWETVFQKLGAMFPSAQLGIGECGTTDAAKKAEYVTRYYTLKVSQPRFVGGFFWWYFRQDMVPASKPLFSTLSAAISSQLP